MGKHWTDDKALTSAVADNLFSALSMLPKRLVRVDAITRQFDMPFSQIQVVSLLSGGPLTVGEISAQLGIAKPNITPLVDVLDKKGLVERSRNAADRRVVHVQLLPAGETLANEMRAAIAQQLMDWPETFSPSEVKRLNTALATILNAAKML